MYNLRNQPLAVKRVENKFKRIIKYWRVSYKQAGSRERFNLGLFTLLMLVYTWWAVLVF